MIAVLLWVMKKALTSIVFIALLNFIYLSSFAVGAYKYTKSLSFSVDDVEKAIEISNSKRRYLIQGNNESRIKLINIKMDATKKDRFYIPIKSAQFFEVIPKQENVYQLYKEVATNLSMLKKTLGSHQDEDIRAIAKQLPQVPEGLKTSKFVPYFNAECDFVSKARGIETFRAVITLISLGLTYLRGDFESRTIGYPLFSLFMVAIMLLESNSLREQGLRFNLQGIQRRVTPYMDFPPTCIGRQITAEHLFVGNNLKLKKALTYIYDSYCFYQHNKHNPTLSEQPVWHDFVSSMEQLEDSLIEDNAQLKSYGFYNEKY